MPVRHRIGTGREHPSFVVDISLRDSGVSVGLSHLSAAAAFAIGFDSAPEPSSTGVLIKTLLGTWVMVMFLIFDVAY